MRSEYRHRVGGLFFALITAVVALGVTAVRADGEAGLVIDYGDGRIETYCIGFTGTAISGSALLERAGVSPGAAGGLVCSIEGTGCPTTDCLCDCAGGGDCTSWSYFTKDASDSSWIYATRGFTQTATGPGGMQGWRWGSSDPRSPAPAPPNVAFEDVCVRAEPTAQIVTQVPPTVSTEGGATTASATASEGGFTPAPDGDLTVSPSAVLSVTREASSTSVVVGVGTTAPAHPGTDAQGNGGADGGNGGIIAFGLVAVVLVGAIGGAVAWRARGAGSADA